MKYKWHSYFPFKKPRKEQIQAIEFALSTFSSGKKYCILEAPTGSGKSAVAIALSRYIENEPILPGATQSSYIITTQKILQQQYKEDFPYIANISAKNNYICQNRKTGLTCDFGLAIAAAMKNADYPRKCCYMQEKEKFKESQIGVTNLPYFLYHSKAAPYQKDPEIRHRKLLVIDEAHNLESIVVDIASMKFTKYFVVDILKIPWPNVSKMSSNQFVEWILKKYIPALSTFKESMKLKLNNADESYLTSSYGISTMKKIDESERHFNQIDDALKTFDTNEWVMSVSATQDLVELKPLFAKKYTIPLLFSFADKVLLMSGTILDKDTYCNNVGIPKEEADFLSMDSPFDVKNRPVFIVSAGSLGRNNIKQTLPGIAKIIEQLLEDHKTEKGIIHCNSYEISRYINDNVKSDRLLFHSSNDRVDILNLHKLSIRPTVLVSPSFTEGIDLVDDLSRFQIIVKIPFPYLGDKYVVEKMNRVPRWYEWQTIKTIIQASGRSIRSVDDYAVTYILDSDWRIIKSKSWNMFPGWYKKAIIES